MKKVFKLKVENKNADRLLEKTKYEIRKYIKREKNKKLPEDVDFWKFECKFGKNDEEPEVIEFLDITKHIDEASSEGCESFYMEILSVKGIRPKKEEVKVELDEGTSTPNTEDNTETIENTENTDTQES